MAWDLSSVAAAPIRWNPILVFFSLLIAGLIGAHIVTRSRWIPRMTGYLLAGLVLGASGFNLLSGEVLTLAQQFSDVAIALVVYQLGRYFDLCWLRREKWLCLTVLCSALLCFGMVTVLLSWAGTDRPLAMLAGVLAIGTAPAVVMAAVRDLGAEGQLARRLAVMTTLNNLVALLAAYILLPAIAAEGTVDVLTMVSHTLYWLCGSLLLAYCTYRLMIPVARWLGRERGPQFVLMIAVLCFIIGAAEALNLSLLLTMLAFAILSRNLDVHYDLMELEFGVVSELFILVLFVTIGASLQLVKLHEIGIMVALVLAARALALGCGIFAFARPARLKWSQAGLLTLGCLPMTEASIGLVQVASLYPVTMAGIAPVLAGVLVVSELSGPLMTHFALIKSGEAARL